MCNGLLTHAFLDMLHRTKLVTERLLFLILKGVGVHGIEPKPVLCSKDFYGTWLFRNVPGNMQRDGTARCIKLVQQSNIFNLFFERARLTTCGKAPKAGAARAQCPTWNGHLKGLQLFQKSMHVIDGSCRKLQFAFVLGEQ